MRWVLTEFPTQASAQEAEMSLADYEDFVYGAGLLDQPDPVALWRATTGRCAGPLASHCTCAPAAAACTVATAESELADQGVSVVTVYCSLATNH